MANRVDLGRVVGPQGPQGPAGDITEAVNAAKEACLPITGGTLTGNLNGKYGTFTWLQSTATSNLTSKSDKICVFDGSNWIYYRTLDQLKEDMGIVDAISKVYTFTIKPINWSSNPTDGYYTNTVAVTGLTEVADGKSIASVVLTSAENASEEKSQFGLIDEIETYKNYVIVRAVEVPAIELKVSLTVIP